MKVRTFFCFTAVISSMLLSGCGGLAPNEPKGLKEKLVDAVPLTGQIVLDGGSPDGVMVAAYNEQDLEGWNQRERYPSLNEPIRGTAPGKMKPDGTFAFQTYAPGDGLPAGKYILLFCKPVKGFEAFNRKYNDPKTATAKVTLEKGKPHDMGKIELTSK